MRRIESHRIGDGKKEDEDNSSDCTEREYHSKKGNVYESLQPKAYPSTNMYLPIILWRNPCRSAIYILNGRKGKPLFVLIIMKREEHWRIQETEHMYTNPTRRGKKKSHINTIQAYMCVYTVYATHH